MAAVLDNALLSTTIENWVPKLEDNIFNGRPFLNWLKGKDRIKRRGGGSYIRVPVVHAENTTVGSYDGYDTIPTTPQEGLSAAEYDWKQAAVSIAISGIEEAKNTGEEQVIDLLKAKTMQAEQSLQEHLNGMFLATSVTGDNWNTVATLVEASGSVGGIDPSTYTWWVSPEENTATALTLAQMSALWNDVSQGTNDTTDFILTTDTLFEKYESLLQPQLRFSDPKTADAGFVNLLYKGAPVVFDVDTPSGNMFFLNSKYLWLWVDPANWMRSTPFKQPTNQDARYSQIICYGNLVISSRRRLGKLTAKTA